MEHLIEVAQFAAIGAFWWAILYANRKERERIIRWRATTDQRLKDLEGEA